MPPVMVIDMDEKDDGERTTFVANGLNGTYIQEWNELYILISDICKIDVCRDDKTNEW